MSATRPAADGAATPSAGNTAAPAASAAGAATGDAGTMSAAAVIGFARVGAAVLSGLLLAAAFPKVSLPLLAWIGFVPLLVAVRGLRPRRAALIGWVAGFFWQITTIYWIPATVSNFTAIPPLAAKALLVLLGGFSAYPFLLLAAGIEWAAAAGISRLVTVPVFWVVGEWMRVVVIAGFPWNPIGNTQIQWPVMAQAADLGGVYLLSALVLLTNAALAEAVHAWRAKRTASGGGSALRAGTDASRLSRALLVAAVVPLLLFAYGQWRLAELRSIPYTGALRVGITQGNIAQDEKWNARKRDEILAKYLELTNEAADAGAQLVVWPEASLPFYLQHDMRSLELTRVARERGIDLLVGAPGLEDRDGKGPVPYNQAWLIRSDGSYQGPYDKIQLVPFGEYIPLHGLFGMVDVAVQSVGQLGQGRDYTIFDTVPLSDPAKNTGSDPNSPQKRGETPFSSGRRARFGTLICYEGIFPSLTREFAARGADFLVNISNDAWYGDTSAPHQHLAMAAMRAIENRLPMVRSTNTGISAFITDEGWIGSTTPLFHEDMAVETVLTRDVYSFYRVHGDLFLHGCQVFALGLIGLVWMRRRAAG